MFIDILFSFVTILSFFFLNNFIFRLCNISEDVILRKIILRMHSEDLPKNPQNAQKKVFFKGIFVNSEDLHEYPQIDFLRMLKKDFSSE